MAIKDESRSVVRPKKKRKRRVAPVQGEQATGGSKVPRRGADEGITVGRRDAPNLSRPPGGRYYRSKRDFAGGILQDLLDARQSHVVALARGDSPAWQRQWIANYDNAVKVLKGKGTPEDAKKAISDLALDIELHKSPQAETRSGTDAYYEEDFFVDTYQDAIDRISRQYGVAPSAKDRQLAGGLAESEANRFQDELMPRPGIPSGRRKLRYEIANPTTFDIPAGADAVERNRAPYRGSNNPAFARIGYAGNVFDFNKRVQAADLAYEAQFGFKPSPGLLLDLVRAPVQTHEYEELFKIPSSFQRARARGIVEEEMARVSRESRAIADPEQEQGLTGVEQTVETSERALEAVKGNESIPAQPMGYEDLPIAGRLGVAGRAYRQIVESFVMAPAGLFAVGKAGTYDIADVFRGDLTFDRSRELGKQMGLSVYEDVRHPLDNPGYLFLDVLGVISVGAGTGARLGAASKAGRASRAVRAGQELTDLGFTENLRPQTLNRAALGQTARATLSGFVRRPNPGTFALGPEGAQEHVLLSEAAYRRAIQRRYYTWAQSKIMESLEEIQTGTLKTPRTRLQKTAAELNRARKSVFSPEKTLGRTAAARMRTEKKVWAAPLREFEEVSRATNHVADVFRSLPIVGKGRGIDAGPGVFGLSVGDQMAILFHATGGPDPVGFWRNWHTKMLEWGIGAPEAHAAKLAAVELGAKAFANPNKRLTRAIEASKRLSDEQQMIKVESLGLSVENARNRLNTEREVLRTAQEATSRQDFLKRVDDVLGGPPLAGKIDDAWYYPQARRRDADLNIADLSGFSRSSGVFGSPVPDPTRYFTELTHRYEAKAIMAGDTVVDASQLAAKYAMGARVTAQMSDYSRLVALSLEKPNQALVHQRGFMRPIRTVEGIPDELRERIQPFFEDRAITSEEMADLLNSNVLKNDDLEALQRWMFPDYVVDGNSVRLATGEPIEGVRWVDERFAVDLHRFPGEPGKDAKFFQAVNEPLRASLLYARIGYSMNALSNAGMLLIQQGYLAPVSMGKSLLARRRYGDRAVAAMDVLIDDGKAKSFAPDDVKFIKISRSAAHIWNKVVDRWMRRAALIYELEKKGYTTGEQIEKLLDPRNDKGVKDRVEISRRANKALVEFDNLTWFEKERLRHYIFVYPWVSRSAVWGVRTMLEHPVKTWAIAELGQVGEKYVEETLEDMVGWAEKKVPDWFGKGGYFPTGAIDPLGNPRIVNANSVNTFSTLADLLNVGSSLTDPDSLRTFEDMLGPLPELGIRMATARNQYGQKYEHGALGGVAEVFSGLPFTRGYFGKKAKPEKSEGAVSSTVLLPTKSGQSVDPADRPVLTPGITEGWGPLVSSGIITGWTLDTEAAEERYWKEQPKDVRKKRREEIQGIILRQRIKDEIRTITYAETITGKILGQPLPKGVKEAVNLQARFQNAYLDYALEAKHGRMPTDAEQRYIQIEVLKKTGKITGEVAEELVRDLGKALNKGDMSDFSRSFADRYLFRTELREWHQERDTVLEIANNLHSQADYLKKAGLYSGSLPKGMNLLTKAQVPDISGLSGRGQVDPVFGNPDLESPLYLLGRVYLEYEKALSAREPSDTSMLEGFKGAEHKVWLDSQDQEVSIKGVKYPSPVRLKWAADVLRGTLDDPEYEAKKLAALSVQGWDTLTNFEKEVIGKPVPKEVSTGWMAYEAITGGLRGNVTEADVEGITITVGGKKEPLALSLPEAWPPGQRDVPKEYKIAIAKAIDRQIAPGFYKDFLHSQKPKYQRLQVLPAITKSANREDWGVVFNAVEGFYRQIQTLRANEETGISVLEEEWKDYAARVLFPHIQREGDANMKRELEMFGGVDFLRSLID